MDINTFLDIAQIKNIDPSKLTSINKEFLYHKIIKILTNFYKYNKLTFNEWVDLVSQKFLENNNITIYDMLLGTNGDLKIIDDYTIKEVTNKANQDINKLEHKIEQKNETLDDLEDTGKKNTDLYDKSYTILQNLKKRLGDYHKSYSELEKVLSDKKIEVKEDEIKNKNRLNNILSRNSSSKSLLNNSSSKSLLSNINDITNTPQTPELLTAPSTPSTKQQRKYQPKDKKIYGKPTFRMVNPSPRKKELKIFITKHGLNPPSKALKRELELMLSEHIQFLLHNELLKIQNQI